MHSLDLRGEADHALIAVFSVILATFGLCHMTPYPRPHLEAFQANPIPTVTVIPPKTLL